MQRLLRARKTLLFEKFEALDQCATRPRANGIAGPFLRVLLIVFQFKGNRAAFGFKLGENMPELRNARAPRNNSI